MNDGGVVGGSTLSCIVSVPSVAYVFDVLDALTIAELIGTESFLQEVKDKIMIEIDVRPMIKVKHSFVFM